MKKFSIILIAISMFVFSFHAQAINHIVTVQDFSFSPSSMTVTVGDTVTWTWVNGTHTTASSVVPSGAQTWGPAGINSTSTSFSYVVMVAGAYNYNCTIHPTQMIGSFTANVSSGILPVVGNYGLILNTTIVSSDLHITYSLAKPASPDILLYNLAGTEVNRFTTSLHMPGTYRETYNVGQLSKGMYFLQLRSTDLNLVKKISVE